MDLIEPMLAKATPAVPEPDRVAGGLSYEPKWDGFRAIVYVDGSVPGSGGGSVDGPADGSGAGSGGGSVEIGSRGSKLLTRYFPELVEMFRQQVTRPCILDGEIVVRSGAAGREHLDWEALSQRIHPAATRVARLAVETPASFIAFDLLSVDGASLLDAPFARRRAELETLLAAATPPLHLTQSTRDVALARRWLAEFEGAGLDGVVAKPLDAVYAPGKRVMFKTKHERTADVVVLGYRIHKSGSGVGSLLLGLYGDDGELHSVGGASAFTDARRQELVTELDPLVLRDESGNAVTGATDRNRFSAGKDVSFVALNPSLVMEVRYDQMEGSRFRHVAQFVRWRPDRDARSCTFEQLERPIAYDLGEVFA